MKGAINILLRNLYQKIPKEILNEAFEPYKENRTLDALIRDKIITDMVLDQCNLYMGQMKKIVLLPEYMKKVDDDTSQSGIMGDYSVYVIPPEAREFRAITTVIDISFPATLAFNSTYPHSYLSGRSVANAVDEALSSFTHLPTHSTPSPVLLDGTTGLIRLTPPMSLHTDWVLTCMLAYDKDFTNISQNMIQPLTNCVIFATQAYIYNKLWIKLNQGFLQSGSQLDSIRTIVETYADADTKFEEAFKKLRGASIFTKESLVSFVNLMVGS